MADQAAINRATPFVHWKSDVIGLAGVTVADAEPHARRMGLWYQAGETRESAAEMLSIFVNGSRRKLVRDVRPSELVREFEALKES